MGLGLIGEEDGGGFGFGAGGEFEALVGEGGFEIFESEARASVGGDVEVGVGPGVFHVRFRELGPGGEDVGGVGLDVDGLLNFSGAGEGGGGFFGVGIGGDFPCPNPIFEPFFKAGISEKIRDGLGVGERNGALPDAAPCAATFGVAALIRSSMNSPRRSIGLASKSFSVTAASFFISKFNIDRILKQKILKTKKPKFLQITVEETVIFFTTRKNVL